MRVVDSALEHIDLTAERYPCAAHTLQLVIKDGLKDIRSIEKVLNSVASLVTKSHKSYLIKERLESLGLKALHQKNVTRWNSQLAMIKSFLAIPSDKVDFVFDKANAVSLTQRECLEELVKVLDVFNEATLTLQNEQFSIGQVLPSIKGKTLNIYFLTYIFFYISCLN